MTMPASPAPNINGGAITNRWYVDSGYHRKELRLLFHDGWAAVGFGADIPDPGDVAPSAAAGVPLIMVRGKGGEIRVFHNVCSHRGTILVDEPQTGATVIRCPYHSWAYGLNGDLVATPHIGGPGVHRHDAFDPGCHGLKPVRCAVWMDIVFVNISGEAADFTDRIAGLNERWKAFASLDLYCAGKADGGTAGGVIEFRPGCNWKLAVENYCESYHLPWVHPGLNSYSRLEDHYEIIEADSFSGQGSTRYAPQGSAAAGGTGALPDAPGLTDYWLERAEYVSLYPNLLLGVHRDHFYALLLSPDDFCRTRERLAVYFWDRAAVSARHANTRKDLCARWSEVFDEDVIAVERMQSGRHSPAFDGGVLSPVMDRPTRAFHEWARKRLGDDGDHDAAGETGL